MANTLPSRIFTTSELADMGVESELAEDYINIASNFKILSTQYQMLKDGTQATTGTFEPLLGWVQTRNYSGFTADIALGEITIPATGAYILDASVYADGTDGIELAAELYSGSAWAVIPAAIDGNPSSAHIHGFMFDASVSEKVRLTVKHTSGAGMNIDTNRAVFSLRRMA